VGHQALLDLRELEDDRDEASHVPLGLQGALTTELEAVEGDVDEVLVQEQVLTLLVGKDDHEGLDQRVPQHVLDPVLVVGIDLLNVNFLEVLRVDRPLCQLGIGARLLRWTAHSSSGAARAASLEEGDFARGVLPITIASERAFALRARR